MREHPQGMADLRKQIDVTDPSALCAAFVSGASCPETVTAFTPVPLCTRHRMQVAVSILPSMVHAAPREDSRKPREVAPQARGLIEGAPRVQVGLADHHSTCVYVISNGSRVKIGITTHLGKRLASLTLRAGDVLLLLRGDRKLESALHEFFADFRVGTTEWFDRAHAIDAFVSEKLDHPALPLPGRAAKERLTHADVGLRAAALVSIATRLIGPDKTSVHLSTILAALKLDGAPQEWTTVGLSAAYKRVGIRVRRAVRVGARTASGIHIDDLPGVYRKPAQNPLTQPPVQKQGRSRAEEVREAAHLSVLAGRGSATFLQRRMSIGFAKAARLMDELEARGIVGSCAGAGQTRSVLLSREQVDETLRD